MGFFSSLFGKKKTAGELLVPCANLKCRKIFKESEGTNPADTVSVYGLNEFKCPYCKEKFTLNREKVVAHQDKLWKKLKHPDARV